MRHRRALAEANKHKKQKSITKPPKRMLNMLPYMTIITYHITHYCSRARHIFDMSSKHRLPPVLRQGTISTTPEIASIRLQAAQRLYS